MILTSKCVYTAEIYLTKMMNSYDWYRLQSEVIRKGLRDSWPTVKLDIDKENGCVSISHHNQRTVEGCGTQLEAHLKQLGYV